MPIRLPDVVRLFARSWQRRSCPGQCWRRAVCRGQGDRQAGADVADQGLTGPHSCTTRRPSFDALTPDETPPATQRTVPAAHSSINQSINQSIS